MAKLGTTSIIQGDAEYTFELGVALAAMALENKHNYTITVSRRCLKMNVSESISGVVEVDLMHMKGSVSIEGGPKYEFEISGDAFDVDSVTIDINISKAVDDALDYLEGEIGIEDVIDGLPAHLFGDPFVGCLIKGGISATIGQTMHCYESVKGDESRFEGARGYIYGMFSCLKGNFGRIANRSILKAFRCISKYGFG